MTGKTTKAVMAMFAVALMMMVALVPAVTVLTDDQGSDAAATDNIDVTGTIKDANGTAFSSKNIQVIVTVGSSTYKAMVDAAGVYWADLGSKTTVASAVVSVNTTDKTINGVANDVYGYTFPTLTLTNIVKDVEKADLTSKTAEVTGTLDLKGTTAHSAATAMYISGINVKGEFGATKTTLGTFKFLGTVGTTYSLTTDSSNGLTFAGSVTVSSTLADNKVILAADQYVIAGTTSAPFGDLVITNATSFITLSSGISFGYDSTSTNMTYYKAITYNTTTPAALTAKMVYGMGLAEPTQSISVTLNENKSASFALSAGLAKAQVKVDTVDITKLDGVSVSVIGKNSAGGNVINPAVLGGDGYFYASMKTIVVATSEDITTPTFSVSFSGYTFDKTIIPVHNTLKAISSTNQVSVVGYLNDATSTEIVGSVTVSAANAVGLVDGKAIVETAANGYKFYVPAGTQVTITPASYFTPASISYTAVNSNITNADFYIKTVAYTGKVLVNGVSYVDLTSASALAGNVTMGYSINGGVSYTNFIADNWNSTDAVYTVSVPANIDPSMIKIKAANTTGKYQFTTSADGYVTTGVTTGTTVFGDLKVLPDATAMSVDVTDNGTLPLELDGVTVTVNVYKGSLTGEKVSTVATGKTVNGVFKFDATTFLTAATTYVIGAVATSGTSTYGTFTFPTAAVAPATGIESAEDVISGYYAGGKVVSGVNVAYTLIDGAGYYISGNATVAANGKYYIAYSGTPSQMKIDATATGFESITRSAATDTEAKFITLAVAYDLAIIKNTVAPTGVYFNYASAGIPAWASVTNVDESKMISAGYFKVGAVFALNADEKHIVELNGGAQYDYSDVKETYTFKCWKITTDDGTVTELKDAHVSYTLKTNAVVEVCYDVDTQVLSESVKSPSNSVDQTVLILGIAAVIIALLAVVYAVIRKKD